LFYLFGLELLLEDLNGLWLFVMPILWAVWVWAIWSLFREARFACYALLIFASFRLIQKGLNLVAFLRNPEDADWVRFLILALPDCVAIFAVVLLFLPSSNRWFAGQRAVHQEQGED